MNVMDYITKKIKKETLHMGLIDPDEQKPEEAGRLASELEKLGTDAVMVGGSTGVTQENMDKTIEAIKGEVEIPVIIFPTAAKALSGKADAIYFMSMLNSQDIGKIIGEQVLGAPYVKKTGLETISMGYVIVEPGMTVGKVGKADPIPRDKPEMAVNYALAAQYLGMKLIYFEAGSGAPEPVPTDMVRSVKENVDIPIVVGGGIRKPEQAERLSKAGADILVTGTAIEESEEIHEDIKNLISAIKR